MRWSGPLGTGISRDCNAHEATRISKIAALAREQELRGRASIAGLPRPSGRGKPSFTHLLSKNQWGFNPNTTRVEGLKPLLLTEEQVLEKIVIHALKGVAIQDSVPVSYYVCASFLTLGTGAANPACRQVRSLPLAETESLGSVAPTSPRESRSGGPEQAQNDMKLSEEC